ncbi:MAG TPA: hypothetical protein VME68_13800 [Acidobacteriaceae bacterium]|nr:hypothetical protein [Acidobacteriaceae bacterium]
MRTICSSALRGAAPILALSLLAATAVAQDAKPEESKPAMVYQTFFLHHAVEQNQATEVVTVLRNELSRARINYVALQNAIAVQGTPDEMAAAQKIIADLDRPIATWKLTYTLTSTDAGKPVEAPQRVTVIVSQGSRTHMSLGNKVPIVTSSTGSSSSPDSQVQYLDVGLSLDAKIDGASDTPLLETKVEQSKLAEEKSGIGAQDPMIRQIRLEESLNLDEGKTMTIGNLDLPGSTRQENIEVTAEKVRE